MDRFKQNLFIDNIIFYHLIFISKKIILNQIGQVRIINVATQVYLEPIRRWVENIDSKRVESSWVGIDHSWRIIDFNHVLSIYAHDSIVIDPSFLWTHLTFILPVKFMKNLW